MILDRYPEYFLTVVSERSISKAAERLHISQPYLSQYIIHLEKEFGIQMFDRRKSPLELTAAGRVYAEYLEDSGQLYSRLTQELAHLNAHKKQSLRVAMSSWRASTLLPHSLPAFSEQYPEIQLELFEQPTNELYHLVKDGTVDFAIMNTDLNVPSYLTTETLLYEKILMVGNRSNPIARELLSRIRAGEQPELSFLETERMVLLQPELTLARRTNNFLEQVHVTPGNYIYSSTATTALNLTAGNYGFCFVNETAILSAPNRKELIFYDLNSPDLIHPLCVVYKKKRHLVPAARGFIDALSRYSKSVSWRSEYDCSVVSK